MTSNKAVPNTYLIGLKRSGTTFLRSFFDQHPDIFWIRNGYTLLNPENDIETYIDSLPHTPPNTTAYVEVCEHFAIGQFTTNRDLWEKHRCNPQFKDLNDIVEIDIQKTADLLKSISPNAKILIVLRNQIDWLNTHYRSFFNSMPKTKNSFSDFLKTPEGKVVSEAAFFDKTLEIYIKNFGRKNVHISTLELLKEDRNLTLNKICDFLGIEGMPIDEERAEYNRSPSSQQIRLKKLANQLERLGILNDYTRPILRPVKDMISRWINTEALVPQKEKDELSRKYAASNARTQMLSGIDLDRLGYPTETL